VRPSASPHPSWPPAFYWLPSLSAAACFPSRSGHMDNHFPSWPPHQHLLAATPAFVGRYWGRLLCTAALQSNVIL
jgi:hypothetical protein